MRAGENSLAEKPLHVGIIGFDGVAALDLTGPLEAFAAAAIGDGKNPERRYVTTIVGITARPFVSESGITFTPHRTFADKPEIDTLIIPGGPGLRQARIGNLVAEWVSRRAARIRRIASVCTGIYGLAPTRLLDGRKVSTHWRFFSHVARRFPALRVDGNALFCKDGKFYTSAGVTAGIDLALALIEEDYGRRLALSVARELVVYLKRPGGQAQYSEPLQFQSEAADSFSDLVVWMGTHLQADHSVEKLAARACLCPRHFSRRFKQAYHTTPASFVENLRLNEARRRLSTRGVTVETIARSVGFRSASVFRRAFERKLGIKPLEYRRRFATRR